MAAVQNLSTISYETVEPRRSSYSVALKPPQNACEESSKAPGFPTTPLQNGEVIRSEQSQ
jgi:hypothetical protein